MLKTSKGIFFDKFNQFIYYKHTNLFPKTVGGISIALKYFCQPMENNYLSNYY